MTTIDHAPTGDGQHLEHPESDYEPPRPPVGPEPHAESVGELLRMGLRTAKEGLGSWRHLRTTPYGLKPVIFLSLIGLFQRFDNAAFSVGAIDIAKALDVNFDQLIRISSTMGLILVPASIFSGYYLDRHKRLPFFAVFTSIAGLMGSISSRGTTTATFGTPRVADNVANAIADVPSYSLLADYYPPEARGRAFVFLSTMGTIAALMATLLVGPFIDIFGVRTVLLAVGIPICILGLLALVQLREPVRGYFDRRAAGAGDAVSLMEDEPQSLGESWRTVWSIRTVKRIFIGGCFSGFGAIFLLYQPLYYLEKYGLDTATKRSYVGIPSVLMAILGGLIGGGLIDRLSTKNPRKVLSVYGIFGLVGSFGLLGFILGPPLWVLIAFSAIIAFPSGLLGPAQNAIYSQIIPPSIRTTGLQLVGLASIPGLIFGPSLAKAALDRYGFVGSFSIALPFEVIGALVILSAAPFFDLDRRSVVAASIASETWRQHKEAGSADLLVITDVDVEYDGGVRVLFGVDMTIGDGELVALLGTNGAGKSTILRAISGTQEASSGAIVFDGRDITHMPPHEIARRGVVHMPGGRGTFPGLTVRENLLLALYDVDDQDEAARRLAEVYEIFPLLKERGSESAHSMSGGEQQQLSLAQAFLQKPRLLMIDELSLGLSPAIVAQLLEIVREINRRGVAIIVVEQSVNVALALADRAIFMEKGEVKFNGRTADLLARPDILRAVYVRGTGALTEGPALADRSRRSLELTEARPVLEVAGVTKRYGGITALDDMHLTLKEGEVLGIVGPNGSGKTTLFDVISGFQKPDAGSVLLDGLDISDLSPEARSDRGLTRRFQDARMFPSLTVYETLLVALEKRLESKNVVFTAFGLPNARRGERRLRARADRLIELLELGAFRDKFVKELSTGLRRIVDLACVLAAQPQVLLLDEPSSGIAQAEAEGLAPLLRQVRFETGCSILIIEHDMPLISAVSDELIAMEQGQFVTRGAPDDVLNDERVISAYLGGDEATINRSGAVT